MAVLVVPAVVVLRVWLKPSSRLLSLAMLRAWLVAWAVVVAAAWSKLPFRSVSRVRVSMLLRRLLLAS